MRTFEWRRGLPKLGLGIEYVRDIKADGGGHSTGRCGENNGFDTTVLISVFSFTSLKSTCKWALGVAGEAGSAEGDMSHYVMLYEPPTLIR